MSFTPEPLAADSAFQLAREALLQDEGLPFADALSVEHIQQAFDAEGVSFGAPPADAVGTTDAVVYTMGVTLWAMLSQALFTDVQRACRAAVQRVSIYYALLGRPAPSTNTGAYCRARAKVTEGVVRRLCTGVAERCDTEVPDEWRWKEFRTLLLDGTTVSMPDTPENQAEYPQPGSQEPGLGFPLMRLVALISLATGMVLDAAMGPYAGKQTGETALFRQLFGTLRRGDLVIADRYYAGWFTLALLQALGVEFVTRLHQLRDTDFSQGKRLGPGDYLVIWPKPAKPDWLDQETYDSLPEHLEVRTIEVNINKPGFRVKSLVVVTSLRNHRTYESTEIAILYRQRWLVELDLRAIKTTMNLGILRCKTPPAVRQELWTGLLAYNLVRQSMLQSALARGCLPYELSFAASLQMLGNTWQAAVNMPLDHRTHLIVLRILNGQFHRVANRPDRCEPRAVKRRPNPIALLTEPRDVAKATLAAG